jgi:hypothetical protein
MITVNKLVLGDNLEILKTMEDETIDLVYPRVLKKEYGKSNLQPPDKARQV